MSIDVTKMERKEPIGAEQDDDTNSVLSLEQILQSPNKSFSTKEIIKITVLRFGQVSTVRVLSVRVGKRLILIIWSLKHHQPIIAN